MKFNIGDKVKYKGRYAYSWGVNGTVVEQCSIVTDCKIIRFTDGSMRHVYIKDLIINNKNQQLLFAFMD